MAPAYRYVSADSHVNPLPTIWRERLPARWRDRAPRVVDRDDGQFLVFEGQEQRIYALASVAGKKASDFKEETRKIEKDFKPGGWDPEARIADQDRDNVAAEVLYGGTLTFKTDDRELRFALMQAYNDWLAEFCRAHPERLIGIAEIPTWDVELARQEAGRTRELGLRGVLIPAIPAVEGPWSTPADRPYTDPWYEPLWQTLSDLEMSANMHLGARPLTKGLDQDIMVSIVCNKAMMAEPIASLIFSGALQRNPKLKIVSVESGIGWMAFLVGWMDKTWHKHRHWQKSPLTEEPSFYFHRQVLGTFIEDRVGVDEREVIGVENIMWSNDYPHSDSTWPNSVAAIEEHFEGVPEDEKFKIVAGNAAALYGIALDRQAAA